MIRGSIARVSFADYIFLFSPLTLTLQSHTIFVRHIYKFL